MKSVEFGINFLDTRVNELEIAVMTKLLKGEGQVPGVLRNQLAKASVLNREFTGVGFYTTFAVTPNVSRLTGEPSFKLCDVWAEIEGLDAGATFVLWVKEGVLHMLEGITYDGAWPPVVRHFKLNYIQEESSKERGDLKVLRAIEGKTGKYP